MDDHHFSYIKKLGEKKTPERKGAGSLSFCWLCIAKKVY
jgi:hypothetical protein